MTGGIKDIHREAIISEIAANDRVERAVLFGSRATGTNTVTSDVDIALFGNQLTRTDQVRLAAALEEIPMAQTVDLVLYDSIRDKELESHIRRHGIEWFARPAVTDNGHAICSSDRTEIVPLNSECSGIDIPAEELKIIQELLKQYLPDTDAWIYDLRGKHASISEADFILVVFSSSEQKQAISDLRDGVKESGVSFCMDLFEWNDVPERLKQRVGVKHIRINGEKAPSPSDNWSKLSLRDCVTINDSTYSQNRDWKFINYLDTSSITENTIHRIQRLIVGRDTIPSRAKRMVCQGDIVYSTVRPNKRHFGVLKNLQENLLVSTGFAVLRGREGIADTEFIYWYLTQPSVVNHLHAIAEQNTSAYPSIKPSDIERLEINLPPLPNQYAIAHILSTIDDKIALNRQMNKTLEAMSRALFKSWFIDFDPVRAKMQGRNTGLPKHIADLFPDRLVDSEFGKIPQAKNHYKEWKNFELNELVDRHSQTIVPFTLPENEFEHFSIPAYDTNLVPSIDIGHNIKSRKTVMPQDAVLLSKLNPRIPRVWFPNEAAGRLQVCSTEFLVFTAKKPANRMLLYALLTSSPFQTMLKSMVTGTSGSHQRVSANALLSCKVIRGIPELFDAFLEFTTPLQIRMLNCVEESQVLLELSNLLLPMLISGELRVKDVGQITNEVI